MFKTTSSKIIKAFLSLLLVGIVLNIAFPLDKSLYETPYSKIYYSDDNTPMRMELSDDGFWRFYATNDQIPILLKNSILAFEDQYFYDHFGINPFAILRAMKNNLTNESRIGASTITMQVVKIVEPKERTYFNKIVEMFRAVQLELSYSKEEILNIYFNKAPYGGNKNSGIGREDGTIGLKEYLKIKNNVLYVGKDYGNFYGFHD